MEIKTKDKLEVGDVLAKPIYNSMGVALLPAGATLTEKAISAIETFRNSDKK